MDGEKSIKFNNNKVDIIFRNYQQTRWGTVRGMSPKMQCSGEETHTAGGRSLGCEISSLSNCMFRESN